MENIMHSGIVTQSTGSWYGVRNESSGEQVECRIRGKLRLAGSRSTNPVVVGDRVDYQIDVNGEAVICTIHPRRNYIIRRSSNLSKESHIIAANIDQALVVVTLFSPSTSYEFIDRFLVTCEAYKIPVSIVLNKVDLARTEPEKLAEFTDIYNLAGYRIIEVSATEGDGLEELRDMLRGQTTLFSGNSGVGKSTLVNALEPQAQARVGNISNHHHKGMHTTTFSTIFPLSFGGYIIDTPGIKGFGLIDIEDNELCRYFADLFHYSRDCQYHNCTHIHEPSCAVMTALEQGKISLHRYESYLKMLDDHGKYR